MPSSAHLPMVAQALDTTCGAACFESMFRLLFGKSHGEMFFAELLGTLEFGYTPPERIVELAKSFGLNAALKTQCRVEDIYRAYIEERIIFATWWFDDAGHYSLVRDLSPETIVLMDPWFARNSCDNVMAISDFIPLWEKRDAKLILVSK